MRRILLALLALSAGCASAPINKAAQPDLNTADAPVLQGCYHSPAEARALPADAPPLVLYRSSICDRPRTVDLERVRSAEPRFVEAEFFLAIPVLAMAPKDGGVKAKAFLTDASVHFPRSPSVAYLFGN